MRALTALALITFRETRKQPTTWLIGLLAAVLILILPFFTLFGLGEEEKMFQEMALSTISLATIVIALFCAANTITREFESRTLLVLLSKPISRTQVVVGKYLGILTTVALVTAVLVACMLCAWIYYHALTGSYGTPMWRKATSIWAKAQKAESAGQRDNGDGADHAPADTGTNPASASPATPAPADAQTPDRLPGGTARILHNAWYVTTEGAPMMLAGAWLCFFATAMIGAALVTGSVFLPVAANAVLALMVFTLGHLMDLIDVALAGIPIVQGATRVLIPNLRLYEIADTFARDLPLQWGLITAATLSAIAWSVGVLALGCMLLGRRDVG